MAADLRHTLLNLESTPPTGAWDAIAARLDTEFDAGEIRVSDKLSDFELAPPVTAWENIAAAIVDDPEEVEAAPVISINRSMRKWAVAAAAVLVFALGGWYLFNNTSTPNNSMTLVPETKPDDKTVTPPASNNLPEASVATDQAARPLPRRNVTLVAQKTIPKEDSTNNLPELAPELLANLPPAGLKDVQSFSSKAAPNVEAPAIRDANGNIILDKELILASDNNYITVTGPNGEQTRMSSKFLPLLGSMNSNLESLDYFQFWLNDNNIWKLRFNEWRDRMMKQPNFIPTATNLLDILELKEFLQEN